MRRQRLRGQRTAALLLLTSVPPRQPQDQARHAQSPRLPSGSTRHEHLRALPQPLGRALHPRRHRPWPAGSGPVPRYRPDRGGPGQSAGRPADLGHDRTYAAQGGFQRPRPGAPALARDRRHPVRQLGGQALLHGAARLAVHSRALRALAADGAVGQLHRRAHPAGSGALHRHGLRLESTHPGRSAVHPVPGRAERHPDDLRLRPHRRPVAGPVVDHGAPGPRCCSRWFSTWCCR